VRTIEVESWLRTLPLARNSCAKIRNLISALFNHAWRYELFDRNPIKFVRQSAKRRTVPNVLTAAEIKDLLDHLALRERTLVLLAISTGLRQSELFALKWGDIDFREGTMNVTRSIVFGIIGQCKSEASQKPVPIHPILAETLRQWKERCRYRGSGDWVFANEHHRGRHPYWDRPFCAMSSAQLQKRPESRNELAGILFATPTQRSLEAWGQNSRSCRNCCDTLPCGQPWTSTPKP
jgi:integrase